MTDRDEDVDMVPVRRVIETLPHGSIVRETILAERARIPRAEFVHKAKSWIRMAGAEERAAKLAAERVR